jgi:RNA polymerase sigma factor (sigma-70 family)
MATLEQVYSGKVKALAGKILRNKGIAVVDADDITQEVAIAHWRDGYDALEWKSANFAKRAITRERTAKRGGTVAKGYLDAIDATNEPIDASNPLDRLSQGESAEAVRDAISRLPADLQRVVDLRFTQGLTFRQIAFELSGNPNSVQGVATKLKRAIEILAGELARFA